VIAPDTLRIIIVAVGNGIRTASITLAKKPPQCDCLRGIDHILTMGSLLIAYRMLHRRDRFKKTLI
jgi:hypothetical protein